MQTAADVADVVRSRLRHNRAATNQAPPHRAEKKKSREEARNTLTDLEIQSGVSDLITT